MIAMRIFYALRRSAKIEEMTTLQDQLDEITANTRQLVQASRLAVSELVGGGAIRDGHRGADSAGRLSGPGVCVEGREWDAWCARQDMLALGPLVV
jgi:hypothetical protein